MSFKDVINQFGLVLEADISLTRIVISLGFALLFGFYIFFLYRKVVNNEFYSKDFNKSLVLMSVITAAIVLSIQSNLVISLGMVGALSIVRYRTAIKSSLDLAFLFFSISIGIICGASLIIIAVALCLIVTITLFILDKIESPVALGLLVLHTKNIDSLDKITTDLKQNTSFLRIKNKTIYKDKVECVFEYKCKDNKNIESLLSNNELVNSFSLMNYDRETRI